MVQQAKEMYEARQSRRLELAYGQYVKIKQERELDRKEKE